MVVCYPDILPSKLRHLFSQPWWMWSPTKLPSTILEEPVLLHFISVLWGSLYPVWSTKFCVTLHHSSTSPSAWHCFQNWLKIFLHAIPKNFWMQISFLEVVLFRKCNWRDTETIFYTYHLATIFLCFPFFT